MSKATANVQVKIPLASDVKAYFFENAVVGETERFRRLNRFEAHYLTTQYLHQPYDWWGLPADAAETISPSVQVPNGFTQPALNLLARQKRPTAPYHLAKAVVDRFTGLLFSETRKPDVEVEGDPDTDDFLHSAMEQMRFWACWREARSVGGSTGSALVTLHLRRGRFVMQCHNPKNVQVLWKDRRALEPLGVLIIYRYPQEDFVTDPRTGETTARVVDYLYRRIITDQDDTVYKPVKLEPGAMRELHWHTNGDEWQYYISGKARMTVFASEGTARTFNFQAGDVGSVPFPMAHYIENIGDTTLRFLEIFKSDHFADVSLAQWLALTPAEIVEAHLKVDSSFIKTLSKTKHPVVPA